MSSLPKGKIKKRLLRYKAIYLMMLPGVLYLVIFHYLPMYGVVIAFKDFNPFGGISDIFSHTNWVGFKHFRNFFQSYYFGRLIGNTLLINFAKLAVTMAGAIVLAMMLNELRGKTYKRITQTISYLPHFLSWVIIAGIVQSLLSVTSGPLNQLLSQLGVKPINFLGSTKYFREVLVVSHGWATVGWGSIVYLAALAGIPPELYESADLDGASRLQKIVHINIPSISGIIIVMLILDLGHVLDQGYEQVLLLYSPAVYKVADVIDTYVYREGIINIGYSYSAAVGLFKNIIAMALVLSANKIVKLFDPEKGVW